MSGGNNMESLLMGGDDSSSGDSDDEVNIQMGTPGASAAASVAAALPPAPVPATPAPAPAPAPAPPAGSSGSTSQSEQLARLKSLYSSQPRKSPPSQTVQPPPQQQQQQQQQPISQRPGVAMTMNPPTPAPATAAPSRPAPAARPASYSRPPGHQQPPQQHQQQQPPPQQQQPPSRNSYQPSSQQQQPVSAPPADPFAPTPLNQIKERQYQQSKQQQSKQQQSQQQQSKQQQSQQQQSKQQQSQQQQSKQQQSKQQQSQLQQSQQQQSQQQQQQQHMSTSSSSSSRPTQAPAASSSTSASSRARNPQDRAQLERELRRQKERFLMFTRVLMKYLEQKDPTMHAKAKLIIKDCAERNKRQERGYESVTASMRERLKELVGEQYWKRAESYLKHFLEQRKPGSSSGTGGGGGGASSTATGGGATLGSSSQPKKASASSSHAQQQQQQQLEQEKARKAAAASSASSKSSRPTAATPAAIANLRQEISQKRQALSGSSAPGAGGGTASGSGSTTPKSSNSKSSKKTTKRKSGANVTSPSPRTSGKSPTPSTTPAAAAASSKESAPAATKPATSTPEVQPGELPPREYKDLMEMVDHAIDYDWTTSGMLLGNADVELSEEQRKLVYDTPPPPKPSTSPTRLSTAAAGWGKQNVISARAGWARVRLREQNPPSRTPVVADGLLKLPTAPPGTTTSSSPATPSPSSAWVNEETAEQDPVLHMLSEGCESYLKGILTKALVCARQRQNLDGIRLWHQQHKTDENSTPPALSLRLGCDVPRQVARAAANAAMTCKRMEQALERQHVPNQNRTLNDETLLQATSMTDLALRPQLSKGAETADYTAKRSLETYGGKEASSSEPPLGRVPKQAKLEIADFVMGSNFTSRIRHRAGPASATMFF